MAKVKSETGLVRVEILTSLAGDGFSYRKGEVVELEYALAKDFINAGYAKEVK